LPPLATAPPTNAGWVERFRADLGLYSQACLMIRTKAATLEPLKLNRAQRLVHEKVTRQLAETGRIRAWILKARQEGISTYVQARAYRGCHLWTYRRGMVLADKVSRAAELFGIIELFQEQAPPEMKVSKKYSGKGQHLRLRNHSQITVETARDKWAGRSLTIQYLHLSEVAFWSSPDDTFLSLMQAVPDQGSEVIGESTANGIGNFFHRQWELAENGESGFLAIFLPWFIHEEYTLPVTDAQREELLDSLDDWESKALVEGIEYEGDPWILTVEQLAWRRVTLRDNCGGDERKFRQEYPSTAREAFLVSGNCFFDEESLIRYEEHVRVPTARGNLVDAGAGVVFAPAERGALRIWTWPTADQPCPLHPKDSKDAKRCGRCKGTGRLPCRYVIFGDTAEGRQVAATSTDFTDAEGERGGRDFCSADVFECESRRFVAQLHGRMAPEVFARDLRRLGYFYSSTGRVDAREVRRPALIGVERNHSSGETALRLLKDELHYRNLFYHRTINRRTNKVTDVLGWVTSGETRQPMLDELSRAFREDSIDYPNAAGLKEMWTFVRAEDGRPEAQEGSHDDRCISAAGALQMARYAPADAGGAPKDPEVSDRPTGW
jgi:hypothetical protein